MQLRILSCPYDVSLSDPGMININAMGRMCEKDSKIWLSNGLSTSVLNSTLLHEIIHVVACKLNLDLDEQVVSGLESGLYSFFVDNVALVKLIATQGDIKPLFNNNEKD